MMRKLECDICLPDINDFYNISAEIVDRNQQLLNMAAAHPQGAKSLTGGRVVVLRDDVSENYLSDWYSRLTLC